MSQKGFSLIVLLVILASFIAGGALVYIFLNQKPQNIVNSQVKLPSPTPISTPSMSTFPSLTSVSSAEKLTSKPKLELTSDWPVYKDETNKFEFKYPPKWVQLKGSQILRVGDLVVYSENLPQEKTESISAHVAIGKPVQISEDIKTYVKKHFEGSEGIPEYSEETINGISYQRVFVCGLGCFTFFYTVKDGYLYTINMTKGAINRDSNDQDLINIINTFKFND